MFPGATADVDATIEANRKNHQHQKVCVCVRCGGLCVRVCGSFIHCTATQLSRTIVDKYQRNVRGVLRELV